MYFRTLTDMTFIKTLAIEIWLILVSKRRPYTIQMVLFIESNLNKIVIYQCPNMMNFNKNTHPHVI